jgi:hypothetical protein
MNSPTNNLKTIPIYAQAEEAYSVGNIRALLAEIAARLEKLAGSDEQLRQTLAQGEVSARVEAIGPSEIIETRYPGVWWVTHYNVEGDIVADMIEIAWLPEIIKSQPADVLAGLELLRAQLND